jgi:predicted TIM-barrel fold metal-dependent hydrolase
MKLDFELNDVHIHLGNSDRIYQSLSIDGLFDFIKRFEISNVAVMPFEKETEEYNKKIIELSKKNDSIHGFYWIKKERIEDDVEALEKNLHEGIIGVKFHSSFENLPVTDSIYSPVMEFLNKEKSTLLLHCGRFKDGSRESTSSFLHGIDLAKKYPSIKIILAHMGGNDSSIVRRAVDTAKSFPNVYFDTSGISTPYRVEYAAKNIGAERIIFGSDYPWCSFRGNYYNVVDSILTEKEKKLIFSDNFDKLID